MIICSQCWIGTRWKYNCGNRSRGLHERGLDTRQKNGKKAMLLVLSEEGSHNVIIFHIRKRDISLLFTQSCLTKLIRYFSVYRGRQLNLYSVDLQRLVVRCSLMAPRFTNLLIRYLPYYYMHRMFYYYLMQSGIICYSLVGKRDVR